MVTIHHDFSASIHLPLRDEPYPLGGYVTVRMVFGIDDEEQLVIQTRVMGAGAEDTPDGTKYRAVAHISADPVIEVLS